MTPIFLSPCKKASIYLLLIFTMALGSQYAHAQYVQPERDDTIRLMAKVPFDTMQAKKALSLGKSTIKGVAFTRPESQSLGFGIKAGKKIYANKIKVVLFPVTPYLLEFLDLKKKENLKKLKFAYLSNEAYRFRLEAITNSDGEFTFPEMKPGKYYLEGVLKWSQDGYYNRYNGSAYNGYGTTNYYSREYYNVGHADLLTKIVEITEEGQILEVKLK